jgi:hypothetical protein
LIFLQLQSTLWFYYNISLINKTNCDELNTKQILLVTNLYGFIKFTILYLPNLLYYTFELKYYFLFFIKFSVNLKCQTSRTRNTSELKAKMDGISKIVSGKCMIFQNLLCDIGGTLFEAWLKLNRHQKPIWRPGLHFTHIFINFCGILNICNVVQTLDGQVWVQSSSGTKNSKLMYIELLLCVISIFRGIQYLSTTWQVNWKTN